MGRIRALKSFYFVGMGGKNTHWLAECERSGLCVFCHMRRMPLRGLKISPYSWCKWDHWNYSSCTVIEANIWWSNRIMLKVLDVIWVRLLSRLWMCGGRKEKKKYKAVVGWQVAKELFSLNQKVMRSIGTKWVSSRDKVSLSKTPRCCRKVA